MNFLRFASSCNRRRFIEIFAIFICSIALVFASRFEAKLFSLGELLSENREFLTTLVYFALINVNVILILILSFLLFRNIMRLIVERKRGVIGSKLRSKLVFALVFFALAPTLLLFHVTTQFIMTSFETWFSEKVQITIEKTREAGSQVYEQDQRRLAGLARIAKEQVAWEQASLFSTYRRKPVIPSKLKKFPATYGVESIKVFGVDGRELWASGKAHNLSYGDGKYPRDLVLHFLRNRDSLSHSRLYGVGGKDVVVGGAPLRDPKTGFLEGIIIVEVHFKTQILKSVEQILSDFADLKPGAQLIRASYMVLIVMIVLLIAFSATWLGFYVAREIISPIQNLAEATKEVALGNYNIRLKVRGDDETAQLVGSFNQMTSDLRDQRLSMQRAQDRLQRINEELDHKRQYLEIVIENVSAGVLAVSPDYRITSVNAAAAKLLKLKIDNLVGLPLQAGLGEDLFQAFWLPISEGLAPDGLFTGQLELAKIGLDVSIIVNAVHVQDAQDVDLGFVIVFDDALEKIRSQRVIAWREVARRIAHEIKNPITPIKLNAQRLVRKFHDNFSGEDQDVFRGCMETIITQVDSLRDLVNEFSKFSKMPSIKPREENFGGIVQEVINLFRLSYPDVSFVADDLDDLPPLFLDREQMSRALVNIFTNALSALVEHRAGVIRVRCSYLRDVGTVRLEVADNGCGIDRKLKERVLEPYFSTTDGGTGLGLAIVHQVVTEHGGYLRLVDNEPHGTVVVIELPLG